VTSADQTITEKKAFLGKNKNILEQLGSLIKFGRLKEHVVPDLNPKI
jgi:hypothetical protein